MTTETPFAKHTIYTPIMENKHYAPALDFADKHAHDPGFIACFALLENYFLAHILSARNPAAREIAANQYDAICFAYKLLVAGKSMDNENE